MRRSLSLELSCVYVSQSTCTVPSLHFMPVRHEEEEEEEERVV